MAYFSLQADDEFFPVAHRFIANGFSMARESGGNRPMDGSARCFEHQMLTGIRSLSSKLSAAIIQKIGLIWLGASLAIVS